MSQGELFECERVTIKGRENGAFDRAAGKKLRRVTARWIETMLAQGVKPPLVILAEIYSEDVDHLAERLECSKAAAEMLRLSAADKAAKYWHDTPGASVELPDGRVAVFMPMVLNGQPAAYVGGNLQAVEPPPDAREKLEQAQLIPALSPNMPEAGSENSEKPNENNAPQG